MLYLHQESLLYLSDQPLLIVLMFDHSLNLSRFIKTQPTTTNVIVIIFKIVFFETYSSCSYRVLIAAANKQLVFFRTNVHHKTTSTLLIVTNLRDYTHMYIHQSISQFYSSAFARIPFKSQPVVVGYFLFLYLSFLTSLLLQLILFF